MKVKTLDDGSPENSTDHR